jgi:hypothetical protein
MPDRVKRSYGVPLGQPIHTNYFYASSFSVQGSASDMTLVMHDTLPVASWEGVSSDVINNYIMFSQASLCPLFNGDVVLYANTWNFHITTGHPEVIGSLEDIQEAVAKPHYVAKSKPGPGGLHADNVVIVAAASNTRTSRLHIFVETPAARPTVSSAMFVRKSHHADVLWEQPKSEIRSAYDRNADVLYISKNAPEPAVSEEGDDGLLLRFSLQSDQPCGVTVPSYHGLWSDHSNELAGKVSTFLNVPFADVEEALTSAA